MKTILEDKLEEIKWMSKNASNWEYYLGQYDLCMELLRVINQDYYYDNYYLNEYGRDYDDNFII